MNRDLVIGIVGSVVLVAAMVGVFFYERNVAPLPDAGTGPGAAVAGPTLNGTVAVGRADEKLVNFTQTSATNVTFHLTWKATAGKDTLKITVSPPTGSGIEAGAVSDPKDTGDITVTVPVPAGGNPQGAWKVKVEFTKADPGLAVTPPTTIPNTTDASVAYKVETSLK